MSGPLTSPLLSVSQTARLLGLSPFSIYRMIESRQIPCFRLGYGTHKRIRFNQAELEAWLQAQYVEAKAETRLLRRGGK